MLSSVSRKTYTNTQKKRWLVSASSVLSRNTLSKVYLAMYIENVTELAFDDITPEDPDFSSIQGLAEAGLIASKLSQRDMNISNEDENSLNFCPEGHLSRQDLVSWKMSLEKRLLRVPDKTELNVKPGKHNLPVVQPPVKPSEENVVVETFVLKSVIKEAGKTGDKPAQEKPVAKAVVKKYGKSGVKPDKENVLQTSQKRKNYIPNGLLAKKTRIRSVNMKE
ncbi:hypothetical protein L2E82_35783 [Cichorium intybus]|uniref:Uncharacterized protein n=1 Tax=Cichorium intybus TaxID=13427 RepID=A0ACB9BPW1_CICIN|nr:hypothetical protein L2E82_35783 [Cichorium intybus]